MNILDFEPTNSDKIGGRMLRRPKTRKIIIRRKKPVRMQSSVEGDESNMSYPVNMDKKIFGMRPRTLAVALGVIVIGILVINYTGLANNAQMEGGGGV